MSSWPGATLEHFLMWNYDVIVDGDGSANASLQIAEALGTASKQRPNLTKAQFAPLVAVFEPYREDVEWRLGQYDESRSWRDYAPCVSDCIPDDAFVRGAALLAEARA